MNSKDAYWFRHDSNAKDDIKCVLLIDTMGLEGYGIFWMLLETLRIEISHKCLLSSIPSLAKKYNTSPEAVSKVIKDYALFEIEGEYFFSKSLLNHIPTKKNGASGEKHWRWKGGVTPENKRIRDSCDYSLWRLAVFQRDNYTCQICGKRGGKLEAHHIKSFARYPELRLDLNNGITLCYGCHKKWHKEHGR